MLLLLPAVSVKFARDLALVGGYMHHETAAVVFPHTIPHTLPASIPMHAWLRHRIHNNRALRLQFPQLLLQLRLLLPPLTLLERDRHAQRERGGGLKWDLLRGEVQQRFKDEKCHWHW